MKHCCSEKKEGDRVLSRAVETEMTAVRTAFADTVADTRHGLLYANARDCCCFFQQAKAETVVVPGLRWRCFFAQQAETEVAAVFGLSIIFKEAQKSRVQSRHQGH